MASRGLNIVLGVDDRKFQRALNRSRRQLQGWATSMNKIGMDITTKFTVPMAIAGGSAIKLAADYQESLNKIQVVLGESSDSVVEFAQTTLKNFGISRMAAVDMAAHYADMAVSVGIAKDKAADLSIELTKMTGDLASFKNIRLDVARTAMEAIFTGETESIKKMGIILTETMLNEYALAQGINKKVRAMSQAERIQLRYNYVMEVGRQAIGDFERTSSSAKNQMRILGENIKETAERIGTKLLPVAVKALKWANEWVGALGDMSSAQLANKLKWIGLIAVMGGALVAAGKVIQVILALQTAIKKYREAMVLARGATLAFKTAWGGLIALGIAAVIWAAYKAYKAYAGAVNSAMGVHRDLKDAIDQQAASTGVEIGRLKKLYDIARDVTRPYYARMNALTQLQSLYPEYFRDISLEQGKIEDLTKAYNDSVTAIREKAAAELKANKAGEFLKRRVELQKQLNNFTKGGQKERVLGVDVSEFRIKGIKRQMEELNREEERFNELIDEAMRGIKPIGGTVTEMLYKQGLINKQEMPAFIKAWQAVKGNVSGAVKLVEEFSVASDGIKKKQKLKPLDFISNIHKLPDSINSTDGGVNLPTPPELLTNRDDVLKQLARDLGTADERAALLGDEYNVLEEKASAYKAVLMDMGQYSTVYEPEDMERVKKQWEEVTEKILEAARAQEKIKTAANVGALAMNGLASAYSIMTDQTIKSEEERKKAIRKSVQQTIKAITAELVAWVILDTVKQSGGNLAVAAILAPAAGALAGTIVSSSIPAFADGGIVYGRTLATVGEYPGASTNPEVIAPLSKLKSIMGGNVVEIQGGFRIDGNDLVTVIDRQRTINARIR